MSCNIVPYYLLVMCRTKGRVPRLARPLFPNITATQSSTRAKLATVGDGTPGVRIPRWSLP